MNRFAIHGDAVADLASGLMWSRDAALTEYPLTWGEALEWIGGLNQASLAGFKDWRLPNRRELFSLVSHQQINPALPAGHPFTNVFPGYYWTSTTVDRLPNQAWYVHLGGARVVKGLKAGSSMVWPVRGGTPDLFFRTGQRRCYTPQGEPKTCAGSGQDGDLQTGRPWPVPRFTLDGDAVTDRLTGLLWTRCADLVPGPVTWAAAGTLVERLNDRNPHDPRPWRLPHIREIESLCDLQQHSPALPEDHPFTHVRQFYWSATTSQYDANYAWSLYLQDGNIGVGHKPGAEFHVWAVRDR